MQHMVVEITCSLVQVNAIVVQTVLFRAFFGDVFTCNRAACLPGVCTASRTAQQAGRHCCSSFQL